MRQTFKIWQKRSVTGGKVCVTQRYAIGQLTNVDKQKKPAVVLVVKLFGHAEIL